MSDTYQFTPIATDTASLNALSLFLGGVFEQADLFSYEYLYWQYKANPAGEVVGFTASQNAQLAAQYALQPFRAKIGGREVASLLSLNTATAPQHRGKGLFTQLAQRSYELARELGYKLIVGVANANSMPGFINKLGFKTLGPLEVRLGFGPLARSLNEQPIHYQRIWTPESLAWRLQKPHNRYHWQGLDLMAPTTYRLIKAFMGQFPTLSPPSENAPGSLMKLYLGLDPNLSPDWRYLKVPQRLRPSPLHFIYKSLGDQEIVLKRENTLFQALDFDAY